MELNGKERKKEGREEGKKGRKEERKDEKWKGGKEGKKILRDQDLGYYVISRSNV